MSVTITRTAWTDDDGSGTTGTVINNAVKTELYDQIDSALATFATSSDGNDWLGGVIAANTEHIGYSDGYFQRVGANSIKFWNGSALGTLATGPLSASTLALSDLLTSSVNVNSLQSNTFANVAAGVSTACELKVLDHGGSVGAILRYNASTFTNTGIHVAQGAELVGSGTGGVTIASTDASGVNRFFSGGTTEQARQDASGHWQFRNSKKLGWHNTPGSTTSNYITGDDAANTITINSNTGGVFVTGAGLVLGAPTGGNKGVGTANFAADIYKNNTAYTNPDYVLEHWATGRIVRFKHSEGANRYHGLRPLAQVERLTRQRLTLPRIHEARRAAGKCGLGAFGGGDAVLATLEESYLYLFNHEARIAALEQQLKRVA